MSRKVYILVYGYPFRPGDQDPSTSDHDPHDPYVSGTYLDGYIKGITEDLEDAEQWLRGDGYHGYIIATVGSVQDCEKCGSCIRV